MKILLNYNYGIANVKNKELYNLITDENGGNTRMRILDEILVHPSNANQIANRLGLDYKTITYHVAIICEHGYATEEKFEKVTRYFPSTKLIKNLEEYIFIKEYLIK